MNTIREEVAHAINGVPGRLFALRVPPAPWKPGTFGNQKWVSSSRPISGYGRNGSMCVEIRFDDEYKNGHNTFAITATVRTDESRRMRDIAAGGCLHDEIAEIFPELAHLIRWHLVSTDGPMHYIANTVYHAEQHGAKSAANAKRAEGHAGYRVQWDEKTVKVANFDHARSCAVWPEATDAELSVPSEELKATLAARLPALMAACRADIEAAGFLWQAPIAGATQ